MSKYSKCLLYSFIGLKTEEFAASNMEDAYIMNRGGIMMNQTLMSSVLFLISASIWAILAIFYDDYRWLNLFLFILFLVMGLAKRKSYLEGKDVEEDGD